MHRVAFMDAGLHTGREINLALSKRHGVKRTQAQDCEEIFVLDVQRFLADKYNADKVAVRNCKNSSSSK